MSFEDDDFCHNVNLKVIQDNISNYTMFWNNNIIFYFKKYQYKSNRK